MNPMGFGPCANRFRWNMKTQNTNEDINRSDVKPLAAGLANTAATNADRPKPLDPKCCEKNT
jgi:hypothetical protein